MNIGERHLREGTMIARAGPNRGRRQGEVRRGRLAAADPLRCRTRLNAGSASDTRSAAHPRTAAHPRAAALTGRTPARTRRARSTPGARCTTTNTRGTGLVTSSSGCSRAAASGSARRDFA
jgi:hypothetical protein